MDSQIQKRVWAFLLAAFICSGIFNQYVQAAGITGNITFTDSVTLDTSSAGTATMVTGWSGLGAGGLPRVQTDDGDFATFVTPGHGVTFHAPWSFNSGAISGFWSVDGFTFNLTSSAIPSGGQGFDSAGGFVSVNGVGTVSGHGFASTPGTFNFTTQDPSADGLFSFSAATGAVPEPATLISLLSGSSLLGAFLFIRRRRG
jgi:PEP-CTERM motif